ncbi:sulfur carrier protein ThiS [Acidobacteria bacterium AH-259-A15]|nr:sulfur carrier protein ThiS [Acidobacteria bacterium AH-259-A15]
MVDTHATREAREIEIIVNGKKTKIPTTWTIDNLIRDLELRRKQVAVEVNEQIISRERWSKQPLGSGDRIEIVHFVGGGKEDKCLIIC